VWDVKCEEKNEENPKYTELMMDRCWNELMK
jgi:hypothetical protein